MENTIHILEVSTIVKLIIRLGKNLFMRMCNFNKFQRLDSYLSLKHPWITRNPESIPTSYFEKCAFEEKRKRFKTVSIPI